MYLKRSISVADKVHLPLTGCHSKAIRAAGHLLNKLSNIKHCIINLYLKSVIGFTGHVCRKNVYLTKSFFCYPLGSTTEFSFSKTQSVVQLVEIVSDVTTIGYDI